MTQDAWAQPTPVAPLSITVSGGGAQGAYMSGQIFYLEHLLRAAQSPLKPLIFSGTSSGSTISIISALNSCREISERPADSLYWRAFMPIGLNKLISHEHNGPLHALSSRTFEEVFNEIMYPVLRSGFSKDCSFIYSAAIHRVSPRNVSLKNTALQFKVSSELVSIKVTGRGEGEIPLISNFIYPELNKGQLLLPVDGASHEERVEMLKSSIFASMALPGILPPRVIEHCVHTPAEPKSACTRTEAESATFVDGGIFNNRPVGIALRAMRSAINITPNTSAETSKGALLRAQPTDETEMLPHTRFYLLDPSIDAYPTRSVNRVRSYNGVDGIIGATLSSFTSVARNAELLSAFDRTPKLKDRLFTSFSHYPMFSDLISGFFDYDFRVFDFYLGMYDSSKTHRDALWGTKLLIPKASDPETYYPETRFMRSPQSETRDAWLPLLCLRAYFEDTSIPKGCDSEELLNLKILSQLSLDRLYDHCVHLRVQHQRDPIKTQHPYCRAIIDGGASRTLKGLNALSDQAKRRGEAEAELSYLFRLLSHYNYHFKDLGLSREQSHLALQRYVSQLHQLVNSFSRHQGAAISLVLQTLSQLSLNKIKYVPPTDQFHVNIGYQFEAGWSRSIGSSHWLRSGLVLELEGVTSPLNPTPDFFAVIPQLALLTDFNLTEGDLLRAQIGARGGYQLSTTDHFATESCGVKSELGYMCSRPLTELLFVLRIANRLRLQTALVWGPALGQLDDFFQISPSIGLEWNSF